MLQYYTSLCISLQYFFSFLFPLFLGCLHYSTQALMVLVILQKYCKFFSPLPHGFLGLFQVELE